MTFNKAIFVILMMNLEVNSLKYPVQSSLGLGKTPTITHRLRMQLQPIELCHVLRNCLKSPQLLYRYRSNKAGVNYNVPPDPDNTSVQPDLLFRRVFDGDLANVHFKVPQHNKSKNKIHLISDLSINRSVLETNPEPGINDYSTSTAKTPEDLKSVVNKIHVKSNPSNGEPTLQSYVETNPVPYNGYLTSRSTILEDEITEKVIADNYLENNFTVALDQFNRNLFAVNFEKFLALRGDSEMSFIQSGLFLEMALMALSTDTDVDTKNEIDTNLGLNLSNLEKIKFINQTVNFLPTLSEALKLLWSSRLVLSSGSQVSEEFVTGAAKALQLKINHFKGSETPDVMAEVLNKMIEHDSGGAIRDTFEADDLTEDVKAVWITTLYFRAQWRSAPTLLNGTWLFRDSSPASRPVRMVRINDHIRYLELPEWDAQAVEVPYLTEGLRLLMLVPRSHSLRHLVGNVTRSGLYNVVQRMRNIRMAVTLPLYTLRMTLLLPNKLQAMGIARIMAPSAPEGPLRISHAVQRIMFWAEAGRNAFKDDGLEWDEPPEFEMVVDRPYIFYVLWKNITILNGNFVL